MFAVQDTVLFSATLQHCRSPRRSVNSHDSSERLQVCDMAITAQTIECLLSSSLYMYY